MARPSIEDLRRRVALLEATSDETPADRAERQRLIASRRDLSPGLRRSLATLSLADIRTILRHHPSAADGERAAEEAREKARIDRCMGMPPSGPAVRREGHHLTFSARRKEG